MNRQQYVVFRSGWSCWRFTASRTPSLRTSGNHRDFENVVRIPIAHAEQGTPADRAWRSFGGALDAHEGVLGLLALSHVIGSVPSPRLAR